MGEDILESYEPYSGIFFKTTESSDIPRIDLRRNQ